MKVTTGLFSPKNAIKAIRTLIEQGYERDDLSMISSTSEIPEFLEGEQEEAAATGAVVGAVTGGATGALGAAAVSTIPGLENLLISGLMSTTLGSAVGAYLGSLYTVRAESQTELNIHNELGEGKILIVVKLKGEADETAVHVMQEAGGEHVETHQIEESKA